jgi:hypothetical protein
MVTDITFMIANKKERLCNLRFQKRFPKLSANGNFQNDNQKKILFAKNIPER